MKIISKYKDFYDYIVQDHDADITFVRDIKFHHEYLDDLFYQKNEYKYHGRSHYDLHKEGNIFFESYIFGIYPYVYAQPIINVKWRSITGFEENDRYILSKSEADGILNNEQLVIDGLIDKVNKKLSEHVIDKKMSAPIKASFSPSYKSLSERVSEQMWKVECKEIFYKLQSPVFVKYYRELFVDGSYWSSHYNDMVSPKRTIQYVSGISFNKLNYNILKYWYDELYDLNTYINIENFLWSVKHEPESEPDNKTKILSHGFDLKTSFRKM